MPVTAANYDRKIWEALLGCSASAKGLFFVMYHWSKQNRLRQGFVERDGRPISREELYRMASFKTPGEGPEAFSELNAVGAALQEGRTIVLPHVREQSEFRKRHLLSVRRSKDKWGSIDTPSAKTGVSIESKLTPGSPAPPLSLSPTTPIPIPPHDPRFPNAAHSGGDGVSSKKPDEKPKPKRREPVFPDGVWQRACEGWMRAYKHIHGCDYVPPSDRAWKSLRDVLAALGGDIAEFEKVVKAWLREPEIGMNKGHEPHALFQNLNHIRGKIAKGTVGHDSNGKQDRRAVAASREYATDLPTEVRRFGNEPDDE